MISFRWTAYRAWALSLALLLTQGLGLHHAVAHGTTGSQRPVGPTQAQADGSALGPSHDDLAHGPNATAHPAVSAGAFHADHAAGDAQCRLVDQLGHVELLWPNPPTSSVVPADRPVRQAPPLARTPDAARAPYQARGPP